MSRPRDAAAASASPTKRQKKDGTDEKQEEDKNAAAAAAAAVATSSSLVSLPADLLQLIMSHSELFTMFDIWPLVCKTTRKLLPGCRVAHAKIEFRKGRPLPPAAFAAMRPVACEVRSCVARSGYLVNNVLAGIQNWKAITSLDLTHCVMDDRAKASLLAMSPLAELDFSQCWGVNDEFISSVATTFPRLEILRLTNCLFTSNALVHIGKLRLLQVLDLGECPQVTDGGLAHLASLLQLRALNLCKCSQITNVGLAHLADLPLERLILTGCELVTHPALVHLRKMPLTELDLQGCLVRNPQPGEAHGLSYLSELKLKHLSLADDAGGARINDALMHLKAMPLEHLNLSFHPYLTSAGLAHLAHLPLRMLFLAGCHGITDLSPLTQMPLVHLQLNACSGLRDDEMKHVAALQQLEILSLRSSDWLTHEGLAHLSALHLKTLVLFNSEVAWRAEWPRTYPRATAAVKTLERGGCEVLL